ncbi:CHASE domain-containing protein [Colwellia sp. 1_MG-2023]|nr:CHASE domain-containing protein [Colwellia sp. 1_MG-2023]MDO6447465.1 CHASE domain-containing protein [Colwellia sp. 1_MG-2023]
MTYETIASYSNAQNYTIRYKGARGFGLIKPVTIQEEAAFIRQAANDRPDKNFNIRSLSQHVRTRFVIQYIFPENVNQKAIGLDIGSEFNRRTAAENAAKNNETTLTAPITLVQASGKIEHGFLLLQPLYFHKSNSKHSNEIAENLYGWTYAPLLMGEILEAVSQVRQDKLAITDAQQTSPFFENQPLDKINDQYTAKSISVYGRTWNIKLFATDTFLNTLNLPHQYLGVITGLLFTFVVLLLYFLLHLVLLRKAQQAQHHIDLARAREEKLSDTNTKLSTEVLKKSHELEHARMLNDSILASATYSVIATDEEGLIQVFNPAAEKLLGYSADELINKQTPALFHLETEVVAKAKELSSEFNENITPGFQVFVIKAERVGLDINQWTYINKFGKHIQVKLSVTALTGKKGEALGYLGIAYDLTETLKREHELEKAKMNAEAASQAKSEFLANMSHELRTPLNGVYGTIQLLKEREFEEHSRDLINTAYNSTKSLITIINDILDFSKIEAGKLSLENKTFKLPVLIEQLNSELSLLIEDKNIELKFTNHINHEYWCGDIVRIRQILINLISNSIKFTEKGTVCLEVKSDSNKGVIFKVVDTGIGIEKNQLTRLFHRFEQADTSTTRKFGGTGLGLAITQKLVRLMGGVIIIDSELEKGTSVVVSLPLTQAKSDLLDNSKSLADYPDMTGKTILVVEDNKINQMVISNMIKPTNAKIIMANNGLEGIEESRKHAPELIFMDIQMPVMDGLTACKKIKSETPKQIIIALTANAIKSERELYNEFFDGYLSKPLEKEALIEQLNQHL